MSEKTKEEEAFQAHKKRFEWLELVTHDGATRLGCKLCKETIAAPLRHLRKVCTK